MKWYNAAHPRYVFLGEFFTTVPAQNTYVPQIFLGRKYILLERLCSYAFCPPGAAVAREQRQLPSGQQLTGREQKLGSSQSPACGGQMRRHGIQSGI